jgi:hypothetical protein
MTSSKLLGSMPCSQQSTNESYSITVIIFCEKYKLWSSSLYNILHLYVTSSLLGRNILLINLFSNTLNLGPSFSVLDQFNKNKASCTITYPYILNFIYMYIYIYISCSFSDKLNVPFCMTCARTYILNYEDENVPLILNRRHEKHKLSFCITIAIHFYNII